MPPDNKADSVFLRGKMIRPPCILGSSLTAQPSLACVRACVCTHMCVDCETQEVVTALSTDHLRLWCWISMPDPLHSSLQLCEADIFKMAQSGFPCGHLTLKSVSSLSPSPCGPCPGESTFQQERPRRKARAKPSPGPALCTQRRMWGSESLRPGSDVPGGGGLCEDSERLAAGGTGRHLLSRPTPTILGIQWFKGKGEGLFWSSGPSFGLSPRFQPV